MPSGDGLSESQKALPNRYIGRAFVEELTGYAGLKKLHLYQALKVMRIDIPYVRRYVREFISIMEPLIKDAKQIEPAEMIGVLRAVLDYDRFITDDDIPSPDDEKVNNINQLQLSANRYADIKSLLTYTETFQDEISNDKNGVSLMTMEIPDQTGHRFRFKSATRSGANRPPL